MDDQAVARIRNHPAFQELERRRGAFSWTLAVLMLAIYLGFVFLVAFAHGVVSTPISGVITLAFPLGLGVIIAAVVLTGIYVVRANTEFDRLTREIVSGSTATSTRGLAMGTAR